MMSAGFDYISKHAAGSDIWDSLRQAAVVSANEMRKFLRGKKLLLFAAMIAAVVALMTYAIAAFSDDTSAPYVSTAFSLFAYLVVIIAAALFAAPSVAGEYEDRTALILFTRPIGKMPIYLGKTAAALLVAVAFTAVYYCVAAVLSAALCGGVVGNHWVSMGLSLAYCVASVGIAMLFSVVLRRSSTAVVMTIIFLTLIAGVLTNVFETAGIADPWYLLEYCSDDIVYSIDGTITMMGTEYVRDVEPLRSAAVMGIWALAAWTLGYLAFRKKEY
jgi:ABC-2 type transport system permease protein